MPSPNLVILACLLLLAGTARGQGNAEAMASVELLVPTEEVRPGQELAVGVKFTMRPGWHVYWTNPGDAGKPPEFGWNLPGGGASSMLRGGEWSATTPAFPTPERFVDGGGLVGHGYAGSVVFPATLSVPASATPGQEVEVTVATTYLVCKDVCLSESAQATARLRVGTGGEENREVANEIQAAADAVPVPVASSRLVRSAEVAPVAGDPGGRTVTVEFAGPVDGVGFFADPPQGLEVSDVAVEHVGGRAIVTFRTRALSGARITQNTFPAVVGFTAAGDRRGVTIDVPVRDAADE